MKNYYEILEVDRKASPEVIEKAYRILVKRYHPDLQKSEKQKEYEEKMKEVNEAYSVLSDDYKRTSYDEQLQDSMISILKYEQIRQENEMLRKKMEELITEIQDNNRYSNTGFQNNENQNIKQNNQRVNYQDNSTISNMGRIIKEEIRKATTQAYNNAYRDAYEEDMRNRGYKIRYKHDLKYYVRFAGCIIAIILIFMLIYQIPIVKRFFIKLYEENMVLRALTNIFKNTFGMRFW